MTSMQPDTNELRQILIQLAKIKQTIDYKTLASELNITPPNTIQQTTNLLEACQEDDALLGKPQIASVVVQKNGTPFPRPGFFQQLQKLNLYHGKDRGPEAEMWHQNELEKVFQYYKS